jgi:hypothetical protein
MCVLKVCTFAGFGLLLQLVATLPFTTTSFAVGFLIYFLRLANGTNGLKGGSEPGRNSPLTLLLAKN